MSDKAKTYDDGKAPLANIPWAAIDEMALVQLYGAQKYGDFNNYRKGMEVTRNLSCAIRHIRDYLNGHDLDSESGRHALGHALCRVAFVLQNIKDGVAIDDRYRKPVPDEFAIEQIAEESFKRWEATQTLLPPEHERSCKTICRCGDDRLKTV